MSRRKILLVRVESEAKLPREFGAHTAAKRKERAMESLHELQFSSKYPSSERFATVLPHFLTLLEGEWRLRHLIMNTQEQELFRQAHHSLAGLFEMEADQ
jgi:hypothetical protein